MADWPPSLKPIGKYLARAKEVKQTDPLVSYYCRYYSLLRAIELRDTSDSRANLFVTNLLEKCEAEKNAIGFDDGTHRAHVEEHALKQFYQADEQDRSGNATRQTATTFYAAMCFLEVCSVFGALPDDLEEKLRYAKWKAADIIKALREGRRPTPGAPGEEQPESPHPPKPPTPTEAPQQTQPRHISPPPVDANEPATQALHRGAQRLSPIPPAPPLREYDAEPHEYEPSAPPPLPYENHLPSEAPPYPSSEEPSPLYPSSTQYQPEQKSDYHGSTPALKAPVPPLPSLILPGQDEQQPARSLYAPQQRRTQPRHAQQQREHAVNTRTTHVEELDLRRPVRGVPKAAGLGPPKRPTPKTPSSPANAAEARATEAKGAPNEADRRKDYQPNIQQTQEAQRLCKYAASALDFEDMKTAVSYLETALKLLTGSP